MAGLLGIPDGDELRGRADQFTDLLDRVATYLHVIAQGSLRRPDWHEHPEGGQSTGGLFVAGPWQIPIGKRFAIRRILTLGVGAGEGVVMVFASPSGATDGSFLRAVVPAPTAAGVGSAVELAGQGSMIPGGWQVMAQFQATNAGTHTIRYEGDLYDDDPRTSATF